MLTIDQKNRLEELRAKDSLNEEEIEEFKNLESLEPEDSDDDAFNKAWDQGDDYDDSDDIDDDKRSDLKESEDDSNDIDGHDNTPDESDNQASDDDDQDQEETPEVKIARLEADLEKEKQVSASWKGRVTAIQKRQQKGSDVDDDSTDKTGNKKKGQGKSDDTSPDDEDDPEVSAFFKEYPDLEKPIQSVAKKIADRIIAERLGPVEENIHSVQATLQERTDDEHFSSIRKAHPDYQEVYESGALESWIDSQPEYLRPRYDQIIEDGSTEHVIAMLDAYKKAAGKNKSNNNKSSKSEDKRSKEKRVEDLEAVPASSAGARKPKGLPNKDDFDGAWDYYAEKDSEKK